MDGNGNGHAWRAVGRGEIFLDEMNAAFRLFQDAQEVTFEERRRSLFHNPHLLDMHREQVGVILTAMVHLNQAVVAIGDLQTDDLIWEPRQPVVPRPVGNLAGHALPNNPAPHPPLPNPLAPQNFSPHAGEDVQTSFRAENLAGPRTVPWQRHVDTQFTSGSQFEDIRRGKQPMHAPRSSAPPRTHNTQDQELDPADWYQSRSQMLRETGRGPQPTNTSPLSRLPRQAHYTRNVAAGPSSSRPLQQIPQRANPVTESTCMHEIWDLLEGKKKCGNCQNRSQRCFSCAGCGTVRCKRCRDAPPIDWDWRSDHMSQTDLIPQDEVLDGEILTTVLKTRRPSRVLHCGWSTCRCNKVVDQRAHYK